MNILIIIIIITLIAKDHKKIEKFINKYFPVDKHDKIDLNINKIQESPNTIKDFYKKNKEKEKKDDFLLNTASEHEDSQINLFDLTTNLDIDLSIDLSIDLEEDLNLDIDMF